jgi:hypothetical protein
VESLSVARTPLAAFINSLLRLLPLPVREVTIDVEAAGSPLERIDHPVTITIELLEMIVKDVTGLGVWRAPLPVIAAGIVALRLLKLPHVGQILLGLNDRSGRKLLRPLSTSLVTPPTRILLPVGFFGQVRL